MNVQFSALLLEGFFSRFEKWTQLKLFLSGEKMPQKSSRAEALK